MSRIEGGPIVQIAVKENVAGEGRTLARHDCLAGEIGLEQRNEK